MLVSGSLPRSIKRFRNQINEGEILRPRSLQSSHIVRTSCEPLVDRTGVFTCGKQVDHVQTILSDLRFVQTAASSKITRALVVFQFQKYTAARNEMASMMVSSGRHVSSTLRLYRSMSMLPKRRNREKGLDVPSMGA